MMQKPMARAMTLVAPAEIPRAETFRVFDQRDGLPAFQAHEQSHARPGQHSDEDVCHDLGEGVADLQCHSLREISPQQTCKSHCEEDAEDFKGRVAEEYSTGNPALKVQPSMFSED